MISLRYAQRFIEGKGLNWNDGHPVEGYSNLLWILGVSVFGRLGIDLILSVRILGILCSLATIWFILDYFRTQNIKKEYVFLAITLLITTPCFAIWAIGGLEQPLYVLLVTLVLIEVIKIINDNNLNRIYKLSVWLGLLALTRPDGFLFTIITSIFLLFINRNDKINFVKTAVATVVIPSLFLFSQLAFRYIYYGELVPNTALVKVKITIHHILTGGLYNIYAFFGTLLISLLGIYFLFLLVFKKKNLSGIYLLLNITAWIFYISMVGGDIFPAYRHYYVVLIFLIFSIILGLNTHP
ncbi:MAG: glycosyltransferase family 39 protein, partial [Flavobacteriaceae bacterium]|nr:glycosyltransferase family 39 protein [Flavobacteriaceae bacterium]